MNTKNVDMKLQIILINRHKQLITYIFAKITIFNQKL